MRIIVIRERVVGAFFWVVQLTYKNKKDIKKIPKKYK